jgi:hypothetical protein
MSAARSKDIRMHQIDIAHHVAIADIEVPPRLRALRPEAVAELAASLRDAEMHEIDENLIRADLTPAEQAAHLARRKALYEQKHPETKHGVNQFTEERNRQIGETVDRYTKDAAKKTGASERSIQRHVARGERISNIADTVGTALDQGSELDALARLPHDRQAELIARAKAGEAVSAKAEAPALGPVGELDRLRAENANLRAEVSALRGWLGKAADHVSNEVIRTHLRAVLSESQPAGAREAACASAGSHVQTPDAAA